MNRITLVFAVLVFTLSSWAQRPNEHSKISGEEKAAYRLEFLTIVLDLTEKQVGQLSEIQQGSIMAIDKIKTQYQPILDKRDEEFKELKKKSFAAEDKAKSKEEMKAVKEKYKNKLAPMRSAIEEEKTVFDKQLIKILSKEQADKYLKLQALKEKYKGDHSKASPNMIEQDKSGPQRAPKNLSPK